MASGLSKAMVIATGARNLPGIFFAFSVGPEQIIHKM